MCAPCEEIVHVAHPTTFLGGSASPIPPCCLPRWVVAPLKDGKGRMAGNGPEAFVVPPFPDLPGDKSMAQVVKVQVRQTRMPAEPFSLDPGEPSQ